MAANIVPGNAAVSVYMREHYQLSSDLQLTTSSQGVPRPLNNRGYHRSRTGKQINDTSVTIKGFNQHQLREKCRYHSAKIVRAQLTPAIVSSILDG